MKRYVVAWTGASGIAYGVRLLQELLRRDCEVHLVVSDAARIVLQHELSWNYDWPHLADFHSHFPVGNLYCYDNSDIAAPMASGSFVNDGMIVVPCTMATLSAIACGSSRSLMERTADVMLKEKRPLFLVPRETPLNAIHLRNMLTLAEMGVHIVPAMPAFYHQPVNIEEIVAFVVGKLLDVMGFEHDMFKRYKNILI